MKLHHTFVSVLLFTVLAGAISYVALKQSSELSGKQRTGETKHTSGLDQRQRDDTAWVKYKNDSFGFEFKHPAIWGLWEKKVSDGLDVIAASKGERYAFMVQLRFGELEPFIFSALLKQKVLVNNNEHDAYLFPSDNRCLDEARGCSMFYIPINHKNKWYVLAGQRAIRENRIDKASIYPEIISTFKFTEIP
jgi:hypothetical protein